MGRACFFSLDGLDGLGKSTQLKRLDAWLNSLNIPHLCCVDPGGTPLGSKLRQTLLQTQENLSLRSEALLFMASRAQLMAEVVLPALAADQVVLSDRFITANLVYQGHAGGLEVEALRPLVSFSAHGLVPDLTMILDAPVATSLARRQREPDRLENRGVEYLEKVRQGFRYEVELNPGKLKLVDATGSQDEIQTQLRELMRPILEARDWPVDHPPTEVS